MPRRFKTPCRFSGCAKLTNDRYCEKHRKTINNYYNKYQRDPEINRRYDSRWRKIRKEFIKSYPLCEICKQEHRLTPAQEVHHIVPLSEGGTHDFDNLKILCKSCHSFTSAKEGDRWNKKARSSK